MKNKFKNDTERILELKTCLEKSHELLHNAKEMEDVYDMVRTLMKDTLSKFEKDKKFLTANLMEYKTYDNTILVKGKKYRWSGCCECGLYTSAQWINMKCKIKEIDGDKIIVYDYDDNKEWEFTNEDLRRNRVTFKKKFI